MKMILIEKYEINKKICEKINDLIQNAKCKFLIVLFSNIDEDIINKHHINGEVKIINMVREIKPSIISNFNKNEYENALKLIDELEKLSQISEYKNIIKSLFGNIYMINSQNYILENNIERLIKKYDITELYLFGKKSCKYKYKNLFSKSLIKNEESISYITINYTIKNKIKLTIFNTENKMKSFFCQFIQPYIEIYGKNIMSPFVFLKRNTEHCENIIIIRSITHIKLLNKLITSGKISLEKSDFIVSKEYLDSIPDVSSYSGEKINISLMDILYSITKSNLKKDLKAICYEKGLNTHYIFALYLINKSLIKNIDNIFTSKQYKRYYCFEETNFYGALISYIARKRIKETITVQHGVTVSYGYTMPLLSNERWVWGKEFKNKYIELGEESNKIKNISNSINLIKSINSLSNKKEINIVISPEMSEIVEPEKWIKDILESIDNVGVKNINRIVISIHPFYKHTSELREYLNSLNIKGNIEIVRGVTQDIIDYCDMIITGNTTVGYEGILSGKRIIFYNKYNDINYGYLRHQIVFNACNKLELESGIKRCLEINENDLELIRQDFQKKYL